jgi:hypothetical protein
MLMARRMRPFVCLLLTVSTVISATTPVQACGCSSFTGASAFLSVPETTNQSSLSTSTPQSCNQSSGAKRSCCSTSLVQGATTPSCCCREAVRPAPCTPLETGQQVVAEEPAGSCSCIHCDCGTNETPIAPTIPSPTSTTDAAASCSTIPPIFVSGASPVASRLSQRELSLAPLDLVITLSRLTC